MSMDEKYPLIYNVNLTFCDHLNKEGSPLAIVASDNINMNFWNPRAFSHIKRLMWHTLSINRTRSICRHLASDKFILLIGGYRFMGRVSPPFNTLKNCTSTYVMIKTSKISLSRLAIKNFMRPGQPKKNVCLRKSGWPKKSPPGRQGIYFFP